MEPSLTLPVLHVCHGSYDDDRGDYHIVMHDHFSYRYEVLSLLGKGSFGQVAKCFDYRENAIVAVKLIRNKKRFHHQALVEVKLLQYVKERDTHDQANIVHMGEYFYFRNHLCITFEVLSINLYELIKNNSFQATSDPDRPRFPCRYAPWRELYADSACVLGFC